ncbi:MAG: glucose 1-dehydrogenase [Leptospiraceae bacterium]|nr:glucose 1-dehydrogenase [Leptospiraceae bacterium]
MNHFEEKVAIVTGGTSGLGRSIAIELAKKGVKVGVCGRREKEGAETIELIEKEGGQGFFQFVDITNANDIAKFTDAVVKNFGRLDFAINNAGIIGTNSISTKYEESDFQKVFDTNVKGLWLCMKYQIPEMLKIGKGAIVNVSSVSGLIGFPFNAPYSASKHAVIGLTKSISLEFSHKGIRINAICPGGIETDMLGEIFESSGKPDLAKANMTNLHSMKRLAKPEEIAKTAVWLCSEEASFITGVALPVDGGWTSH